ncbi:sulfite exporter TauE/SafE family protein [Afipia birgiae]|jgi:uncharacterized protein|uniref:sulfite exporter TauE/SafE family protein n=1 Tax=Afipia birgiae TaxID=151414 RepID=UPI0002F7F81C|nr:sulfite exporter TauE/SafE family protein [Afipia birgiae]MBX9823092.1 sulfite exporter TauE/SafE family protein [Afipia birgiae]
MISLAQGLLGAASGSLVGFSLGLVGGGGSILAVPLMVYLVGVPNAHVAIGTSAFAVAASAAFNLIIHARSGMVKWGCASVLAGAGVVGAFLGSLVGKMVDGQRLLVMFALLMLVIAALMRRRRDHGGNQLVQLSKTNAPVLSGLGLATGILSGFFGIGGGFLIVPALVFATDMPLVYAVSSSLVAVLAFGLTTAASYAFSGLIDWPLTAVFIVGGLAGGYIGVKSAHLLADRRSLLNDIFVGVISCVAIYMLIRSWMG